MVIETVFVKLIVDAVLAGLKKTKGVIVKKNASTELNKVIRNLLQLDPDINAAQATIQAAIAAGVISKELVLAKDMLSSVRVRPKVSAKKAAAKPGRVVAKAAAKKKSVVKPVKASARKLSTTRAIKKSTAVSTKRSVATATKK